MRVFLPSKRDFAIGYVQQPVVRDRDTVRIARQVVQYMLRSNERRLGVDYPVLTEQRSEKGAKCPLGSDGLESSGKLKLPTAERPFQTGHELPAKHLAENLDGQEQIAWMDPPLVIGRETAGGDDAMNMGMKLQVLAPDPEAKSNADLIL